MKVSEVLTRRALRCQGNYLARLITETLSYLDELESRGAIPRPMPTIYSELRESLNVSAVPSDVLTQVVEDFFERFCMPDDVIAEGRRLYSARNMPGGREGFEAWLLEHGRALFGMPGEDERGEEP